MISSSLQKETTKWIAVTDRLYLKYSGHQAEIFTIMNIGCINCAYQFLLHFHADSQTPQLQETTLPNCQSYQFPIIYADTFYIKK